VLLSLVVKQNAESVKGFNYSFTELHQVALVEVNYISCLVDVGLLRALNTVAESDSELTLNEHSCTVFLVVLIPESARVETKHLSQAAHDLRKHSDSLVRAVMERVLRSIHEHRLSLRVLVEVNEGNDLLPVVVLCPCALETMKKPAHGYHLRNEALINLRCISPPLCTIGVVFELAHEHPIHILAQERCPIISERHTIWIDHRNDLKYELCSKGSRCSVALKQRLNQAMHDPARMGLARVDARLYHDHFLFV
jgi:hypothetical protein